MTSSADPVRSTNVLYVWVLSAEGEEPPSIRENDVWLDPETSTFSISDGIGGWSVLGTLVAP